MGRYVRIELPGDQKTLTLAEVEVFSDGKNVARQGKATQSSTAHGGDASKAIDGNKSGSFGGGGQTHTAGEHQESVVGSRSRPGIPINSIVVYNRTDGDLGSRLRRLHPQGARRNQKRVVFEKKNSRRPNVAGGLRGRRRARPSSCSAAPPCCPHQRCAARKPSTFKALAKFVQERRRPPCRHPGHPAHPDARTGPRKRPKPLLDGIARLRPQVPTAERTTPAVLDALQLADSLAALLPLDRGEGGPQGAGRAGRARAPRRHLTDQMLFDKERIAVQAGKPVEIIFENTDLMPHNLVITQPGGMEEVGTLAEAHGDAARRRLERHYVPNSNKSCWPRKLLQPRNFEKLSFTAPTQAGRLSLRLHLSRPLAAHVRRPVRRRRSRRIPRRPGRLPGEEPAADQGRRC